MTMQIVHIPRIPLGQPVAIPLHGGGAVGGRKRNYRKA
jgi:hypothetical protein